MVLFGPHQLVHVIVEHKDIVTPPPYLETQPAQTQLAIHTIVEPHGIGRLPASEFAVQNRAN